MKVVRKIMRIIGWILLGIVGLLIIVLIAIQTSFVKKQIVRFAEKQVNTMLNAELSVGRLSGNLFTNIQLDNVLLKSLQSDTLAHIPALHLKYKLLPLLKGEIILNEIIIDKPFVYVEQMADSTWNLQHIMKSSADTVPDTISSTFNMLVQLEGLQLNEGNVLIKSFNPQIPDFVNNLNMDVSGSYRTNEQQLNLKEFNLRTINPNLEIKNLKLEAEADTSLINMISLVLETAQNKLSADGEYYLHNQNKSHVQLVTDSIKLEEFRAFLPDSFNLRATPVLSLNAELQNDQLSADMQIKENSQGIELTLLANRLLEYLADSTALVNYDMNLAVNGINLQHWLNDPAMQYIINGKLTAKGEGFDPETLNANVQGDFGNLLIYGNPIQSLNLLLDYNAGDVSGLLNGSGSFGEIHVQPELKRILSDMPSYLLNVQARKLNIAAVTGQEEYTSDINLDANINGAGFDLNRINAKSLIEMSPSKIMGVTIDTLNSSVDFIRQNLIINNLFAQAFSAQLLASGNYSLKDSSDLKVDLKVDNVDSIARFLQIDSVETSAHVNAHLAGVLNNLNADVDMNIGRTKYKDMVSLDSLTGKVNATIVELGKSILANGNILAGGIIASGFEIDTVKLQATSDTKNTSLDLSAKNKDMNTHLNGIVSIGDTINAKLAGLWLNYKGYDWRTAKDTAFINVTDNEYTVRDLHLVSPANDSVNTQSIVLDGKVSRVAEQDLKLDITNIDIAQVMNLFNPNQNIAGLLDLNLQLSGAAASPVFNGKLNVDSTRFEKYRINTLSGDISLQNNILNANMDMIPQDSGKLQLRAYMPAQVRLDSMQFNLTPQQTDSVYARLLIEKLPLSILNIFLPTDDLKGLIESNMLLDGVFAEPNVAGNFNIRNGAVKINKYGVNYHNIQTAINVTENEVKIDTFLIRSNDGDMKAGGNIKFDSPVYAGRFNSSGLGITFNRFNPIDHKQYNMELSGDIDLDANTDSVYFSGELTIPEMQIFLPAIMNLMGQPTASNIPQPLLVMEMHTDSIENGLIDSLVYTVRPDTTGGSQLDLFENLQGKLRVIIPRNTWIRNDDMRLELSGDVELLKHRDFFELFGTIDVVRGQYTLLGKTFVIETGTLTFQGGEDINPILNIDATYSFRDSDRTKHDLGVSVTGEMNSPNIEFTLEGSSISEGDALSYIIFGRSMDALTSGQQDNLASGMNAADIGTNLAASLISSQLTKFLGNALDVDYIEFKTTGAFDNASFVVGKYITNKLFVSYEQTIGNIQDDDIARYEVTMEYELFKFLFLQLTSSPITNGFDVIFKVNSKK